VDGIFTVHAKIDDSQQEIPFYAKANGVLLTNGYIKLILIIFSSLEIKFVQVGDGE